VIVKDKNGLPAPDGTVITGVTNGFGAVVRSTTGRNEKGTVNGVADSSTSPRRPGTAVVTSSATG
jgi:hypothetical protein